MGRTEVRKRRYLSDGLRTGHCRGYTVSTLPEAVTSSPVHPYCLGDQTDGLETR